MAWQLGGRSEPHLLLLEHQLGRMSSDWQPFTWVTEVMTKGKPVRGIPHLFQEMFVSAAPNSIIS